MGRATKVKICGVTKPEFALAALEAGAEYIGLMFAESPRRITKEQAKEIADAVKRSKGNHAKLVGVFVNRPVAEIAALAKEVGFDIAQLSGDESEEDIEEFDIPLIKAVHVGSSAPGSVEWLGLRRKLAWLKQRNIIPLLDAKVAGKYGGTGQAFDHELALTLAKEFDFLLAGGLNPDNVTEAIAQVHPWGVDVSSGVEKNGIKDPEKIRDFLKKAKA